jgi:hypothetical protein
MRQRPFVLKDLTQITAIDPAAAGRAFDEVLGLVLGRIAQSSTEDGAAGDHLPHSSSASRFTAGAAGFLNLSRSGERPELYRDPHNSL